MRIFLILLGLVWNTSAGDFQLTPSILIRFAAKEKATEILLSRDTYIRELSPMDRSIRLKTERATTEQFLKNISKNTRHWEPGEITAVKNRLTALQSRLQKFAHHLPDTIYIIKTTGGEDIGAPYTRQNAVVLPASTLASSQLGDILVHELFHILSRHNIELRDALYAGIGFFACDTTVFPENLNRVKLTNPDAPFSHHYIRISAGGNDYRAVPVIYSKKPEYNGGSFFDYFSFALVAVKEVEGRCQAIRGENGVKMFTVSEVSGFFEQTGTNTKYIIHPEEILADNFVLLVNDSPDTPSPLILKMMEAVLLKI